jgi:beta-glucosidase
MKIEYPFPKDFLFGAATASYQVEGAAAEDGRLPSVWDTHAKNSGLVKNGDTGDVACDHYHRYREDIALMKNLGIGAYRFSCAWPRIIPDGDGAVNQKGIDFYDRLIDGLLEAGIEPWMTLYHWDTPQAIEDKFGGWRSRKTAEAFGRYAEVTAKAFSDRVTNWFTMNEFVCFTNRCYLDAHFPPALSLSQKEGFEVRHNALLAHGLAVQAIRANAKKTPKVGIAENPVYPIPVIETEEHIEASRKAFRAINSQYLTPIMEGAYPAEYLERMGADLPGYNRDDLKIIGQKLDFLGLNMYFPLWCENDGKGGFRIIPFPKDYPKMHISWLRYGPDVTYWGTRFAKELWNMDVYITENGCSGGDDKEIDGQIKDTDRLVYFRHYLRNASRAVQEGYPLKGYFHWSLMDNFEWNEGFSERFGLIHVDYATQKRTPKLSYDWYRQVIKERRVL